MVTRTIAILGGVAIVVIALSLRGINNARVDAMVAHERVQVLEGERLELERQAVAAAEGYKALQDSLYQAHDSLADVREGAIDMIATASESFRTDIEVLRDSIYALQPDGGLGEIVDRIQADHEAQVQAYEVQVKTLDADKLLLWRRVDTLDSLWTQEQSLNAALRSEIAALNQESDAWQRAANPNIFRRIGGSVPYILVGAGVVLLLH